MWSPRARPPKQVPGASAMPELTTTLPARRPELILSPLGDNGHYVLKDPRTGSYYRLGAPEAFIFARLDGRHSADAIHAAYQERLGEPLEPEELDDFLAQAEANGLIQRGRAGGQ